MREKRRRSGGKSKKLGANEGRNDKSDKSGTEEMQRWECE